MNTATHELTGEPTDEELNRVSGGKQTATDTAIQQGLDAFANAVAWVPLFGQVYKTTYDTAKQLLA
jgi:hypothetical protein